MKKFLSLVLALVMTMSLVTVSAGATEYKDLTDKDEIQYEEAVAVLNRIGIITGYTDGSFQPKKELTRGAAAKIIVSLMIGSEAASNLVAASAPYTDVPVNHTFAGVISYCKNSGYINGYQDGSFKPEGTLSGYAFAKMLLGALGYKGEHEGGFTGAGWTMNVARIGNESGLFDRLSFKGNEAVNREQACQLALNTLKGTLVEYTGGMNIVNGTQSVVVNPTRTYKTSNQEFATHINNRKSGQSGSAVDDHYTVEFGEEHFVDLRMKQERSVRDDFGRPSNEWSYKKVTIGTYPAEADFTYTAQVAHDVTTVTDASKVRALGLDGYKVDDNTVLHVNGRDITYKSGVTGITDYITGTPSVAKIADLTDNGTLVEVYVSDTTADLITDIVVVKTQLMEVKRVGSDDVTLDKVSPDNKDVAAKTKGYNQEPLHEDVIKVEVDNGNFEFLKGLKAGDEVAVVPVTKDNGTTYEVFKAYTPEKVEGKLTRADTYGNASGRQTVALTVGGTEYKAALWNKKIVDIDADSIKYTKGDVTLFLDEYGYALKAKGVGETEDFMVIKDRYQTIENGKLVTYVEGWDIKGNELSLNVGTSIDWGTDFKPGDLVEYTNVGAKDPADWVLLDHGRGGEVYRVNTAAGYEIKASNVRVGILAADVRDSNSNPYITNDVKFIFVTFDGSDVDSIEVKDGVQNVENKDLLEDGASKYPAQLCLNDDGEIKAVVIKKESNSAVSTSLLYIRDWDGGYSLDNNGKRVYKYTVARMSKDGFEPKEVIWADRELPQGAFASYSASTNEGFEPFYKLKEQTDTKKTTSVNGATVNEIINKDKGIVRLADYTTATNLSTNLSASLGAGDETNAVSMIRSEWLDLTGNSINSVGDLKDFVDDGKYPIIQMIYNDNPDNDGFRTVSLVIILDVENTNAGTPVVTEPAAEPDGFETEIEQLPAKNDSDPQIRIKGTPDDPTAPAVTSVDVKVRKSIPAARAADPAGTVTFTCTVANGRLTVNPDTKVFTVTLSKADIASVPGSGAIIIVETTVSTDPVAPTCTCDTQCSAGNVDSTCDVCKDLTDDFTACEGGSASTPTCTCTDKCSAGNVNGTCDVCKGLTDDFTNCTGKVKYTVAKGASLTLSNYTIGELSAASAAAGDTVKFTLTQTTAAEADNAKTAITLTNGSEGDITGTAVVKTPAVEAGDKYTAVEEKDWDTAKAGTVYKAKSDGSGYEVYTVQTGDTWAADTYYTKTTVSSATMGVYEVSFVMPAKNVEITAIAMAAPTGT